MENDKKSKKATIIGVIAIIAIILILAVILLLQILADKQEQESEQETIANIEEEIIEVEDLEVEETKEVQIFSGNDRVIAVMIDNHKGAWPQAGLNEAYMVYEIIVEGGETRLMALFKGADLENIGPVRSSRHYFLDYALENDAIYVHYGWSPQAKSDITTYSVNNINGITCSSTDFWRITGKSSPHNVMTSTASILSIATSKGYATTSTSTSVLNYVADEFELDSDDAEDATSVTIPVSTLQKVQYKYDSETKRYTRYARGVLQTDYYTGESITTKNIIIQFMNNSTLEDDSGKGRQTLNNIGTFDGYYISNGKAIKITCTKNSRTSKTIYKDMDGNILEVNDGNTWINVCPKNANVVIE